MLEVRDAYQPRPRSKQTSPVTTSVKLPAGSAVAFIDASGASLGTGFFNAHSLIAGRLVSRDAAPLDRAGGVPPGQADHCAQGR